MQLRCGLLLLLVPVEQALAQPPAIFHWTLDEDVGTQAQELNGYTPGVLLGGAQWASQAGHHQGACRFDGVDDRILLGPCDMTSGTGEFSLSLWVRPDFVTAMDRTLIAKTVGPAAQDHIWSITLVNASALRFRLRAGPATVELSTAPSSIFSGAWYHMVGSYDGSMMRVYLNGALMAETAASGSMGHHPQAPSSVAAISTGASPFSGWVDDIRLFDVGLDQQDVIDLLLEDELTTNLVDRKRPALHAGRLVLPMGSPRDITLLDGAGRHVGTYTNNSGADGIDLRDVQPGLYLVCLQGDGERATWPIMVM